MAEQLLTVPANPSRKTGEQTCDVLLAFTSAHGETLGVTEIARTLGKDKSSVHHYLIALCRKGLVVHDPVTRRYLLGPRIADLYRSLVEQRTASGEISEDRFGKLERSA